MISSRSIEITDRGLAQSGSFQVGFGLILKVHLENYPFTPAMNATETCGTDPSKTLMAASSPGVTVEVNEDPKIAQ